MLHSKFGRGQKILAPYLLTELICCSVYMTPPIAVWKSPSGKVILIGDGAHAISPLAGQGGVMVLEDAEAPAYALLRVEKRIFTSCAAKVGGL
jgi:hypothetical protein